MKTFEDNTDTIIAINVNLAYAALSGVTAFVIWPSKPEWWGFGLISMILTMSAVAGVIQAIKAMRRLHNRNKEITTYAAQGGAPKTANVASRDVLRDAGMTDD